jgi:TctA family transporter
MRGMLKMKLIILFFVILWYNTCKTSWRSAKLVIIVIQVLKIGVLLFDRSARLDVFELIYGIPVLLPLIYGFFYLYKKVKAFFERRYMIAQIN